MPLIPRAQIQSRRLHEIAAYLDSKRRNGVPPGRSDIDPVTEIPKLAQHLMLMERGPAGRFRYRLMGSIAAEIQGRDMTGLWVDDVPMDKAATGWEPGLPTLFATDELLCGVDRPPWEARTHIVFEWISLRLTVREGTPQLVLVATDYHPAPTAV